MHLPLICGYLCSSVANRVRHFWQFLGVPSVPLWLVFLLFSSPPRWISFPQFPLNSITSTGQLSQLYFQHTIKSHGFGSRPCARNFLLSNSSQCACRNPSRPRRKPEKACSMCHTVNRRTLSSDRNRHITRVPFHNWIASSKITDVAKINPIGPWVDEPQLLETFFTP
jgi:hypothetical protein